MPRLPIAATALASLLLPAATPPSVAQQREPGIEVYGLSGVYSTKISRDGLKPEVGAGVLLPLGRKWAALVDTGYGVLRLNEYSGLDAESPKAVSYRRNPHLTNEGDSARRVATIRPAIVRMWRRDRFSVYVGAGLGVESEYNRWRFRRVRELYDEAGNLVGESENEIYGTLVREESFTAGDNWSHAAALIGRFGVLLNLTPRIVVRAGYSCVMTYLDKPLSGAIEAGIGYRF